MKFKHLLIAGLLATTAASPAVHASHAWESLQQEEATVQLPKAEYDELTTLRDTTLPLLEKEKQQELEVSEDRRKRLDARLKEVDSLREKIEEINKTNTTRVEELEADIKKAENQKSEILVELEKFTSKELTHSFIEKTEIAKLQEKAREAEEGLRLAEEALEAEKLKTQGKGTYSPDTETVLETSNYEALVAECKAALENLNKANEKLKAAEKQLETEANEAKAKMGALEAELEEKLQDINDLKGDLSEQDEKHKEAINNLNEKIDNLEDEVVLLKKEKAAESEKAAKYLNEAKAFHGRLNPIFEAMDVSLRTAVAKKMNIDSIDDPQVIELSRPVMFSMLTNAPLQDKSKGSALGISSLQGMFDSVFGTLLGSSDLSLFINISYSGEQEAKRGITEQDEFVAGSTVLKGLDFSQLNVSKSSDSSDSSDSKEDEEQKRKEAELKRKQEEQKLLEEERIAREEAERKEREEEARKLEAEKKKAAASKKKTPQSEKKKSVDSSNSSNLNSDEGLLDGTFGDSSDLSSTPTEEKKKDETASDSSFKDVTKEDESDFFSSASQTPVFKSAETLRKEIILKNDFAANMKVKTTFSLDGLQSLAKTLNISITEEQ